MDPLYKIINYIFNKHGFKNEDITYESFFENGLSFPKLVEIAFNSEVPSIIKKPKFDLQRSSNNTNAFKFLYKNSDEIKINFPMHQNKQEKEGILKLILTKYIFKIDQNEIKNEVNLILIPLGIKYDTYNNMINFECLGYLLQALTKEQVKHNTINFANIEPILKKLNVPFVINESSLSENSYSFFIQIKIILDILDSQINQINTELNDLLEYYTNKSLTPKTPKADENSKPDTPKSSKATPPPISKPTKQPKSIFTRGQKSSEKIGHDIDNIKDDQKEVLERFDALPVLDDFSPTDSKSDNGQLNGKDNINEILNELTKTLKNSKSDGIQKVDKKDGKTKKKKSRGYSKIDILNDDPISELNDNCLLEVIKTIFRDNKNSDDFKSLKDVSIPTFVSFFFGKDPDLRIAIDDGSNNDEVNCNILEFLKEKSPIFEAILLNFNLEENEKGFVSNLYIFYTTFLNCFYVKRTRQAALEITAKIMNFFNDGKDTEKIDEIKNYSDFEQSILYDWNTYYMLFLYNDQEFCKKENAELEFRHDIICILRNVDNNDLQYIDMNLLYIQMHLILDEIESKNLLPELKDLNNSNPIDPMVIERQRLDYQEFINDPYKAQSVMSFELRKKNRITKDFVSFYEAHLKPNSKPDKFGNRKQQIGSARSYKDFWDPVDDSFIYDEGILISKNDTETRKGDWDGTINRYQSFVSRVKYTKDTTKIYELPLKQTKLYKFFIYDEIKREWKRDLNSINSMSKDQIFKQSKMKISLVFFSNSNANDIQSFTSKLITFSNPRIMNDSISVLGFCENAITIFKYEITELESSDIKPVFLFLNVPESKKNRKDLPMIIFRLYYFMSIINHIEIVILNKEHFNDQLKIIRMINNIKYSYKTHHQTSTDNSYTSLSYSTDIPFDDNSSDGDEDFVAQSKEEDEDEEEERRCNRNITTPAVFGGDVFSKIVGRFSDLRRYIFLVNDNSIHDDFNETSQSPLFRDINDMIYQDKHSSKEGNVNLTFKINYININEPKTFRDFLDIFIQYVNDSNENYEDAIKKTSCTKTSLVSSMYLKIKSKKDYQEELKKCINIRYGQLLKESNGEQNELEILSKLKKELIQSCPLVDDSYNNSCNACIKESIDEIISRNGGYMSRSLRTSSNEHLNYLGQVINNEKYWTDDEKDWIKKNYINFMENEFFTMIKIYYTEIYRVHAFEKIKPDFDKIVEEGIQLIDQKFVEFKNNLDKNNKQKTVDLDVTMRSATNYTIKETENVRQIKVEAQSSNWEDEIGQDY